MEPSQVEGDTTGEALVAREDSRVRGVVLIIFGHCNASQVVLDTKRV